MFEHIPMWQIILIEINFVWDYFEISNDKPIARADISYFEFKNKSINGIEIQNRTLQTWNHSILDIRESFTWWRTAELILVKLPLENVSRRLL